MMKLLKRAKNIINKMMERKKMPLPDRTDSAIKGRAKAIETGSAYMWTDEEDEILRKYYPQGGVKKCMEFLPERSKSAIVRRTRMLGITKE